MEFDIDKVMVEKMQRQLSELRKTKPISNGPIDKIKRYDWKKDPNGYLDENGNIPFYRCYHCGYQYNQANGLTAFCNVCTKALKYIEGGILTEREKARTRVPDGKTPVNLIDGNRLR